MSRRLTRDGAQLLIAQSATSTFQGSWAPEQHASLAALRAAESGRPMVHATLTGVSAVYGPDGEAGRPRRSARTAARPPSTTSRWPAARRSYVRFGDWPVYGALAVLAALCAAEGARSLRTACSRARRTTRSHSS